MKYTNIINEMLAYNKLFIERSGKDFFAEYQDKQEPQITMVSCIDSRVHTEAFVDSPFNKIFPIRNIGNQIYTNEGSVDYGILYLKTPILLILGHTDCGAVKASLAGYQEYPASIRAELDHMIPAININDEPVMVHVKENLDYQISIALEKYQSLIDERELMIIGAIYDFKNELGEGYGKFKIVNINGETQE